MNSVPAQTFMNFLNIFFPLTVTKKVKTKKVSIPIVWCHNQHFVSFLLCDGTCALAFLIAELGKDFCFMTLA